MAGGWLIYAKENLTYHHFIDPVGKLYPYFISFSSANTQFYESQAKKLCLMLCDSHIKIWYPANPMK